jgi:hypothetical protein
VQIAIPCAFESARTLMDEKGLSIGIEIQEDSARGKESPTDSIGETAASMEGSDGEERESFDEIERRYLERFGGEDDMV